MSFWLTIAGPFQLKIDLLDSVVYNTGLIFTMQISALQNEEFREYSTRDT